MFSKMIKIFLRFRLDLEKFGGKKTIVKVYFFLAFGLEKITKKKNGGK